MSTIYFHFNEQYVIDNMLRSGLGAFLVFEETVDDFREKNNNERQSGKEVIGKNNLVHDRIHLVTIWHLVMPAAIQLYIVLQLHKVRQYILTSTFEQLFAQLYFFTDWNANHECCGGKENAVSKKQVL